jgi:transposase
MRDTALLQLALGLTPPWTVSRSDFDPEAHRLDIQIDFAPGSRFACPTCGAADCSAYDTERMTPAFAGAGFGVTSTSSSIRPI